MVRVLLLDTANLKVSERRSRMRGGLPPSSFFRSNRNIP